MIKVGLSSCFFLVATNANAMESKFLELMASLKHDQNVFYNCQVEVVSEPVNFECKVGCLEKVLVRVGVQGAPIAFFGDIFSPLGAKFDHRSVRAWYAFHPHFTVGSPDIAGVIWTGDDGRILALRIRVIRDGEPRFVYCSGVGTRRGEEGIER